MEHIEICPLCSQSAFTPFLICEDFMLSHEQFQLQQCQTCSFIFTSPRPDPERLPEYYASEKYISHSNKSAGILDRIYLLARKFTLQWKTAIIEKHKTNATILDYGCGTGEFLHHCQHLNWKIAGVELSGDARQKASLLTGTTIAKDLTPFGQQKFDVITLWHVLEHISDLKQTIISLTNLLTQNGVIFIAVPNHESYDAHYYHRYWAAYDVPRHLWHFSKKTMQQLLEQADLKIIAIKPMKLDAYYVSLLSEKYMSHKSISLSTLIKGMIRGFISNRRATPKANHSSLIYIATKC